MKSGSDRPPLSPDKALVRMLVDVTVSTIGTMAISVLVVAAAVPLIGLDATWRSYALALVLPAILTPLFSIAYVRANYRLHQLKRELKQLADSDPLTGLLNRRSFFERANSMLAQAGAETAVVAVMMVDFDHFKIINDKFGHAAGDAVIQIVSKAIAKAVANAADGRQALVARFGGEEFVVMADGLDVLEIEMLAQNVLTACRDLVYWVGRTPLSVTVSIGLAVRAHDQDIDSMLLAADAALYEAKRGGRDRWFMAGRTAELAAATLVPDATVTPIRRHKRTIDAA